MKPIEPLTGVEHRERFYRSVAETLALLHAAAGRDRVQAMTEVAQVLASTMQLPLVWVGRVAPGAEDIDVLAASGPASGYTETLRLNATEGQVRHAGPLRIALHEKQPRFAKIDAPEFAPWRERAQSFGLASIIAAATETGDGGRLTLAAYASDNSWADDRDLTDWAQRLVDELARFWDDQALLERTQRISRYREAQRRIQRALLDQPDPDAIYRTLAGALVEVAGAAAVDVYAGDVKGNLLRRAALAGPRAEALRLLPTPTRSGTEPVVYTPTRAFMTGKPVVRIHPAQHGDISDAWKLDRLRDIGAVGCWPVFADSRAVPAGVFAVVTEESDAFDREMCTLFDEIAEAAGLALRQHGQRAALARERERQTYFALHDPLTDLPNRRGLEHHLEEAIKRAARSGRMVATGLLDLDDFKPINDRYGHAVGDRVLVMIAKRLRGALRASDYVARLGGDEFVLVLEGIEREQDLDILLLHVWKALNQPLRIDGLEFELSASLGVALYPQHGADSGDQLMRRADQAMYRVKSQKRERTQWWSLPPDDRPVEPRQVESADQSVVPYGPRAVEAMTGWVEVFAAQVDDLINDFCRDLAEQSSSARLLEILPEDDRERFHVLLASRIRTLLRPDLEADVQRRQAARLGLLFSASGVEEVMQLEAIEHLRDLVSMAFGAATHRDRRPLSIILQRLAMERQWQIESMRELQRRRVALLAAINALAWSAGSYLELMQGVVDTLATHPEIMACTVGRPNPAGNLTYEAVAGKAFRRYLEDMGLGKARPISVSAVSKEGGGPSGRAWRTAAIQRSTHYAKDPSMAIWAEGARRLGVRSNASIPLCRSPLTPVALLTIYSPFAGGYRSDDQQAFLDQIKTVLDLALARLAPLRSDAQLLSFLVRDRWRQRVTTDALQMHFQPVVPLRGPATLELEALARLNDNDGSLLLPGQFMPALTEDDLLVMFGQSMRQATACRQRLLQEGHVLDVAVNVPASALRDPEYLRLAARTFEESDCPPSAVLMEILESPIGIDDRGGHSLIDTRTRESLMALKGLGVRLVEDDLGSGYSSLIRLRQWPFDRVKIDQQIVHQLVQEPLSTLRFIRQLVRLGHELGMEVVVEGLESPGMVEAAVLLGADMGQGFALARPMPVEALSPWFAHFQPFWNADRLNTGMGALASALIWEERLLSLAPEPDLWHRFADAGCGVDGYLKRHAPGEHALHEQHQDLHRTARRGPSHPSFQRARDVFMASLVQRASEEEQLLRSST